MNTELVSKNSIRGDIEKIHGISDIENIITECMPVACARQQGVAEALVLAKGVQLLREFFLKNEAVKDTIMAVKDTKLGFLTDRSTKAIDYAKGKGKRVIPYSYEEIAECCIEALLTGYRLTGNEFNVIAGGFYAAKNGKYRKIIETPLLTEFKFGNSVPVYLSEQKGKDTNHYAKITCWADWTLNGASCTEKNLELKIRVNYGMGDDAIVGKALSKLFTRVLMQTTGQIIPESTDITDVDIINVNQLETQNKIKEIPDPFENKTEDKTIAEEISKDQEDLKNGIECIGIEKLKTKKIYKDIPEDIKAFLNNKEFDKIEACYCSALIKEINKIIDTEGVL